MLKKMKIPAVVVAALLLLYTLLGFLAAPALVRSQAIDYLHEQYGLALAIDELRFNPYTLQARAEGVSLDDAGGARLVSWDGLAVDLGWRSLWERALVFQSIALSGPFVHVELRPDGDLNLASAFAAKTESAAGESAASDGDGIAIVIDEFVLERGALRFSDLRDGRDFDRSFAPLALRLHDFSTRPAEPSELVSLRIALGERGALTVAGELTATPLAFALDLDAQDIPLEVAQPYVPETLAARIASGALSFALHAAYGTQTPEIAVRGDAAIAELAIEVAERDDPVLAWRELALRGIEFELAPDRLAIAEIAIDGFDSVFRIHEDGTTNVGLLLGAGTTDEAADEGTEGGEADDGASDDEGQSGDAAPADGADDAGPAFPFSVGRIVIDDSTLLFNDRQIRPAVAMQIEDLSGEVTGVSSAPDARIEAKLAGRVGGHGSADIGGHIAPFVAANDLQADVSFGNVEMTEFSPYAGKFAGYEIAQGKLFLDLHYTLAGNRIQGENRALFDQFELGERVDSEDATSLPVKFALSLLRDRHGRIDISLPIEGDIDAPGFRFGHLIGQALLNTLTKIVTAPFSFIAGVFGGGPDMEYADFTPGSAEMAAQEQEKILPLVRALDERPRLILEVQGWAEREQDGGALRQTRLAETLAGFAAAGTPADEVLRTAFEAEFGADATAALRGELEAAAAPPAEHGDAGGGGASPADVAAGVDSRLETEMQARLLAAQQLTEEDLTALAFARGRSVMRTLVEGGAPAERIFVRSGAIGGAEDGLRARLILGAR